MNQRKQTQIEDSEIEKAKICLETARIPWRSLQRFFAAGKVYEVSSDQDLTEVAFSFSADDKSYVEQLMNQASLRQVADDQALRWYEEDAEIWAVVVKPFVLVQADQVHK